MRSCRLHITGASGAGVTTLARAVAGLWAVPCHDTDDYFWEPTDPPYTTRRPEAERLALMERMFLPRRAWVLGGGLIGWGDGLIRSFDRVVFLHLDPALRLARLEARETARLGAAAIAPGGARHDSHRAFMAWAAGYDDPAFSGRSRAKHEAWLARLTAPVLRLDAAGPVAVLAAAVAGFATGSPGR